MATGKPDLPKLYPVGGFKLGTASAGIKTAGRPDSVSREAIQGTAVAAIFNKNSCRAAPVLALEER